MRGSVLASKVLDALTRDYNPNHDAQGRFASSDTSASPATMSRFVWESHVASRATEKPSLAKRIHDALTRDGGPGSGDFGHAGRPGEIGGSGEGGSDAKPTAGASQTETPAFRAWFGASKVVKDDGTPLIVYHGTNADFENFAPNKSGENFGKDIGYRKGFFFSTNPETADVSQWDIPSGAANIKPVFLSLQNPYVVEINNASRIHGHWGTFPEPDNYYDNNAKEINTSARNRRADGVIVNNIDTGEKLFIAYKPEQIKSAIGNSGNFNPKSAKITDTRGARIAAKVSDALTRDFSETEERDGRGRWPALPTFGRVVRDQYEAARKTSK